MEHAQICLRLERALRTEYLEQLDDEGIERGKRRREAGKLQSRTQYSRTSVVSPSTFHY